MPIGVSHHVCGYSVKCQARKTHATKQKGNPK
nr:MAG TPA: hypothetical protein [Caudoviricetes sp.]